MQDTAGLAEGGVQTGQEAGPRIPQCGVVRLGIKRLTEAWARYPKLV